MGEAKWSILAKLAVRGLLAVFVLGLAFSAYLHQASRSQIARGTPGGTNGHGVPVLSPAGRLAHDILTFLHSEGEFFALLGLLMLAWFGLALYRALAHLRSLGAREPGRSNRR